MKKIIKKQNGGTAPTGTQSWFQTYGGNIASNLFDKLPNSGQFLNGNNFEMGQVRDGISNVLLSSGNPYAMAVGLLYGIGNKVGVFSDTSQGLGFWNDVGNATLSLIPGLKYLLPKTDKLQISREAQALGDQAYRGTIHEMRTTQQNSGLNIGFGINEQKSRANKFKNQNKSFETIGTNTLNDITGMKTMAQPLAQQYKYVLAGGRDGYPYKATVGKLGMKIERVKQISSKLKEDVFKPTSAEDDKAFFDSLVFDETPIFQEGGKVEKKEKNDKTYQEFLLTLPENLQQGNDGEDGYRMRYLFDNSPNVWNFEDALKENLFELNQEDNTYHGFSIFPLTGEFLKSKNHPTVQNELDWYNSDDAKDFREEYDLITEEDGKPLTYYKYKKKVKSHKEGGQMNVIPEGSLHARLHHMEGADNLTKKGIPVVDNEGNQQAEIERSELIFNKEVTDKLEELLKKFNSEEHTAKEKDDFAIEAGKLLSTQIIENTDDRAGLINKVENEQIQSNN